MGDMDCVIGVDFDNTIVSYDDLLHQVAAQRGLIDSDVSRSKKEIRDRIRQLPKGEIEWQKLQALIYGPRMAEARLIEGVPTFFKLCKQYGVVVYIVSHKTEYANFDETGISLREAALGWMAKNKFFDPEGLGLSREKVYFGSTRREKIEHIRQLGCSHFIDDLEEMFLENSFPTNVEKILYAPHRQHSSLPGVSIATAWKQISDYFFEARS